MELAVLNVQGAETGRKVNLPDSLFGIETPNDQAIYEVVKGTLANQRQGTHKAKERGEVSGSKKKPYRQKGTGSARAGHKRSPLWRHGGRVFGPRPRDYSSNLNRKVKALARASALTYKAREEAITVVEDFNFEKPRTKDLLSVISNLKLNDKKILMVLPEGNENIYLSGRNIPGAEVIRAEDLYAYAILNADNVVILEKAVEALEQKLGN